MMADDYDVEDEGQPQSPLEQFSGMFRTPAGQALAQEAQTRINHYAQTRQLAEANTAAGQAFTDNLSEMRQNFTAMVQDDPAATPLALDLAHLGVSAMVSTIHGADPAHIDPISTGLQQDIARSAVMSAAEKHEGTARGLLDHPRISDLLGDEKDALSGYISGQAVARRIDGEAAQKMSQRAAVDQANQSAGDFMAAMVDPDTGDISHPPGWAERVMADQSMPPHYKAALFDVYGHLTENGDAAYTDPYSFHDLVRAASVGGLAPIGALSQAGSDLRAADAVYLARMASDPAQRGVAQQLSNVLDQGKDALAGLENGPAGQRAFTDFTNWALSAARSGADLDPGSKTYLLAGNRLQQFAPRATYTVEAAVRVPPQDRRPLAEIFGNRRG